MRRIIYCCFFFFLSAFTQVQNTEVEEYNLKAVFIYNFTKYINWNTYNHEDVFVIGVLGKSSIVAPLTEIARTKKVGDKKVVIRQFKSPEEITFTNILFISRNNTFSVGSLLHRLDTGTLTVAEEDGMAEDGMAFNFVIHDNKLKFEANLKAISNAGLKVSSELLQHAIIVNQ